MGNRLIKEIGEKFVEIDGIKIRVTIKMIERDYPVKGEIIFQPHAKFYMPESPLKELRKRHTKK
ncbi:hypothetical protein LCGC14_0632760 [marine sediment metagenome]|uniref:Uncharacterized protein n=1 Tax=marine sediment metagenome TaxID=412755 RepID=A0A0F9R1F7_9ZZZZ